MKKIFGIAFAIMVLATFLGACATTPAGSGGNGNAGASSAEQTSASQVPQVTTFGIGDTQEVGPFRITADAIQAGEGTNTYLQPAEGNMFIGVSFTVENISGEEANLSSLALFSAYVDDIEAKFALSSSLGLESLDDAALPAGKKVVGAYVVEAPIGSSVIEIHFKGEFAGRESVVFTIDIPASEGADGEDVSDASPAA